MKRFTDKQKCLDWLVGNFFSAKDAMNAKGALWDFKGIGIIKVAEAFRINKHTDLDSKQQLEQRVVESFNANSCALYGGEVEKWPDNEFDAVEKQNKYIRNLKGVECDVYDVLKAFDVTCPALQHLIKKALCAGLRGHKDKQQDLKDILDSAKRAIELNDVEV